MKKSILSLFIFGSFFQISMAQSFEITSEDTLMADGDNFVIQESHAKVKNISGQPVKTLVTRELISLLPEHVNYFCWGVNCYGPFTSESPDTISLNVQEVNETFKGYLDPGGVDGVAEVRYCFVNADNSSDKACYKVRYLSGVASTMPGKEPGQAVQVPATYDAYSQTIKVNVAGGKIEVWNMLGQKVDLTFRYDGTGMVADASSLKPGYYFLFGNNEKGPWSARVVVSR